MSCRREPDLFLKVALAKEVGGHRDEQVRARLDARATSAADAIRITNFSRTKPVEWLG